jgi:hypothetical protein
MIVPGRNAIDWKRMVLKAGALVLAGFVSLSSSALAEILFYNPLFTNPVNGNCSFQCAGPGSLTEPREYVVFMADNFVLTDDSLVTSVIFDGIRTGTNQPVNRNFLTSVDWGIYSYNPGYLNNLTSSSIGTLLFSGTSRASQRGIVDTPSAGAFTEEVIRFLVPIPLVRLEKGQYWLALHANVSGWDGSADDTCLYLAYGQGDGIFAWNLFPSDGTGWTNPNPNPGGPSGMAFAIVGRVSE